MRHIYLDYNTTTPLAPSVFEAMRPYFTERFHAPAQQSTAASVAWEALETAREQVAALLGSAAENVFFTSGGTEANSIGVLGPLVHKRSRGGSIVVGATEHDSVWSAAQLARRFGYRVVHVPCDPAGVIDPESVAGAIRNDTRLVCIQIANGILGTIQPVKAIADVCHGRGVPLHCDATLGCGLVSTAANDLHADSVAISAHHICGPKGVGALLVRPGYPLGRVAGSSSEITAAANDFGINENFTNVAGAVGMGVAAKMAVRALTDANDTLAELRDRIVWRIQEGLACEFPRYGFGPSLANTACIELPAGIVDSVFRRAAELTVRTASVFDPPDEFVRCLSAVGRDPAAIRRTMTISVGWTTSRDDVDMAASWICEAAAAGL